jgi:hypothetical protein
MTPASQRLLAASVAVLSVSLRAAAQAVAQAQPESNIHLSTPTSNTRRHLAWQELDCPADRPVPSPEDFIPAGDAPVDPGDQTSVSVVGTTIAKAPWRCNCNATIALPTGIADGDRLFLFVGGSDGLTGAWTDAQDIPSSRLGRLVSDGWEPILKAGSTDLNIVALTKLYEAGEQSKSGNVALVRRNAMEEVDGDKVVAANQCIACSNTPSPKMIEREQNCSSYKFAFTDRCGNEDSWWGRKNKPKYCQYSCWNNNASYADDIPCCERGDEDDFLQYTTEQSNNNADIIGSNNDAQEEERGNNKKDLPLLTTPIVSSGIRVSLHEAPVPGVIGSENACIDCSNIPTSKMIKRGENCSTYEFGFTDRCGNEGSWWGRNNRPKHCQFSCWHNGAGYADDPPCCKRSDADDFVPDSTENNAQQNDRDGPSSPLTVISDGVRNTWLTMVALRGLDPENPLRGSEYIKTKSAQTCKTGEAMAPGLRMARGGVFLAVVNFDDPHRGTVMSPEKAFHILASYSSGDDGMAVGISGQPTSGGMMEDVKFVGQSKLSGGGQAIGLSLSLRGK